MLFDQSLVLFFSTSHSAAFGEKGQKLSFGDKLFAHIKTSNKFSLAVDLGISRPSAIVSQPISHILVLDDVVKGKLYLVVLQHLEHGFCKPALRLTGSSLDKDDHRRLTQNAFDLRMPYFLLLLKSQSMSFCFLCQRVKNDSHIICFEFFYFFLISLGEQHCWCVLDFQLFEGLWTFLSSYGEILDILKLPEERNCGYKVILELN